MTGIKLNAGQERLYFISQSFATQSAYNLPLTYEIKGALDVAKLIDAIKKLGEKHPILLSKIAQSDIGLYFEPINAQLELIHQRVSLEETENLIKVSISQNFDLQNSCASRFLLLQISESHFILCITLHHIISDGRSMHVLLSDIVKYYRDKKNQDFEEKIEAQYKPQYSFKDVDTSWWKKNVTTKNLDLPTDFQRPPQFGYTGDSMRFLLPQSYEPKIKNLCKKIRISENILFLSVFAFLLKNQGQETDFNVGIPFSFRSSAENEDIGFFINTLPLRIKVEEISSIKEWMIDLQFFFLDALENASVPFSDIVAALNIDRDPSRTPVYQSMFVYQRDSLDDFKLPHLDIKALFISVGGAQCDLLLSIEKSQNGWPCFFEYNTDIWESSTISLMIEKYISILGSILDNFDTKFNEIKFISDGELRKIISWQKGPPSFSSSLSKIMRAGGFSLTHMDTEYSKDCILNYSYLLSSFISSYGLKQGDTIAVLLDKGVWQVLAPVSIWRSGFSCLMLNSADPAARIATILGECRPKLVLSEQKYLNLLPQDLVIGLADDCLSYSGTAAEQEIADNAHGYLIFTSGSTGLPKGILHPRRTLANLGSWILTQDLGNVLLQFAAPNFDMFLLEVLYAWLHKAHIVIPETEDFLDPIRLSFICDTNNVTGMMTSVSMLQFIAEHCAKNQNGFQSLKAIATAGEQLVISDPIKKFFEIRNQCHLYNYYGPSETHVVTYEEVDLKNDSWKFKNPSIGRPLNGCNIFILDSDNRPVAINTYGELGISGDHVALGYTKTENETGKFVLIQTPEGSTARVYKTGDIARWLPDGKISYYGRIDTQIKVRGYRIELEEIERAISSFSSISQCCVIADGTPCVLKAFIVINTENFDRRAAVSYLETILPKYMIPSYWIELKEIPKTQSGKIDRKKISSLEFSESYSLDSKRTFIESPLSQRVLLIYKKILGHSNINIEEDFFLNGGNSLSLVKLSAALEKEFQINFPLPKLLRKSSPADIMDYYLGVSHKHPKEEFTIHDLKLTIPVGTKGSVIENKKPCILLTGCSGTIGFNVLVKLLRDDVEIFCFCRNIKSFNYVKNKIEMNFPHLITAFNKKCIYLEGNLEKEDLGLSDRWLELTSRITHICHIGAYVSHVRSYIHHRQQNVLATYQLFRLATEAGVRNFVYLSTLATAPIQNDILKENIDPLSPLTNDSNGYILSKEVSERLISRLGKELEINTQIIRPSFVLDTEFISLNPSKTHMICFLRICIETGLLPDGHPPLLYIPLEECASIISEVTKNYEGSNIYNVSYGPAISGPHITRLLQDEGYNIALSPFDTWHAAVAKHLDENHPFQPFFSLYEKENKASPQISCENTNMLKILESLPDQTDWFKKFIRGLSKINFIPPAPHQQ